MSQDTERVAGESQVTAKTILLVEDESVISSMLVEVIEQETPYQTIVAADGRAALQLVQHFTPDLLLLDYRLPGMNGIELYDRLHSNEALSAIPAILMTASRQLPQQQLQQRQLIAFRKPFELGALLAALDTLLSAP